MASLAATTGTRIDSACKHQIAVRMDYEHSLSWVGFDNAKLERDDAKWCMAEVDMAIGTTKPLRQNEPSRTNNRNKAYPSVVVTLAEMDRTASNYLIYLFHNSFNMRDRDQIISDVEHNIEYWVGSSARPEVARKQIQEMPEFVMIGVSVGLAHVHPNVGDNVATTMIGGLKTVLNGAFPIETGDWVQWYWDEERPCFDHDGKRLQTTITGENGIVTSEHVDQYLQQSAYEISDSDERRRKFYDRGNGNYGMRPNGKQRVAFPKAFRYDDTNERIYDRLRVFARALSSARPYEHVDIMIARQSL